MSHGKAEDPSTPVGSGNDDDLAAFLLDRLARQKEELEVDKIFRALVKLEGSDLHMRVGSPPMVRIKGELRPLNRDPVDSEEMVRLLVSGRKRSFSRLSPCEVIPKTDRRSPQKGSFGRFWRFQ